MMKAACHKSEMNQPCTLDLRVYDDGFIHTGKWFLLDLWTFTIVARI